MTDSAAGAAWPTLTAPARSMLLNLLVGGPAPRAELAGILGMSKSSLTRITRELVDAGLVVEGATELRSSTGRPSELLRAVADARHFVGIKLTGDTLYAAVTDLAGDLQGTSEQPLLSSDPERVVDQIGTVVHAYRETVPDLVGLGVTLAGSVRRLGTEQVVLESEFLGWHDVPLSRLLSEVVALPTEIENDVQALAATEHWFGSGAHLQSLVLITIGAGVGCALISNGQLVVGAYGRPGRIGHLPIDRSGPICASGHRGCVNMYLTNTAIEQAVSRALGRPVTYADAVDLARAGDRAALRAFDDGGSALGEAIGMVANLHDPQKVVITGDGIALWDLSEGAVHGGIRRALDADPRTLHVEMVPFEFDEWARAAAVLALRSAVAGSPNGPSGALRASVGLSR